MTTVFVGRGHVRWVAHHHVAAMAGGRPGEDAVRHARDAGHGGRRELLVRSGLRDAEETFRRPAAAGPRRSVTDRARVPCGPAVTRRLPWPRAQGLIGAGEGAEEPVVVRAERS
ncbi:hypothetical protein OHA98_24630 [Streptomyces sp. NBC_00654]|uniref:hypothetical protein n=1 Tax=Streptomyces sp. NBC_00654 TaxID=2975799 RepID=UPI00225677F5|nr:hypothetical protein [Streptomyces sp. NBC_00654]MCX4967892.1 hypothetical protein [Streptomyces sp. NBC_00654]